MRNMKNTNNKSMHNMKYLFQMFGLCAEDC